MRWRVSFSGERRETEEADGEFGLAWECRGGHGSRHDLQFKVERNRTQGGCVEIPRILEGGSAEVM